MSGGRHYYVYIMASRKNGTLYVGITNNLNKRANQHKIADENSFVGKYKIFKLVYYEIFNEPIAAIKREKRLKKWNRVWKIRLIEEINPNWYDLFERPEALQKPVSFTKV